MLHAFATLLIDTICSHVGQNPFAVVFENPLFLSDSITSAEQNPWRDALSPQVTHLFPLFIRICNALGCAVIEQQPMRAIDVISSLTRQAHRAGVPVVIVSPDRSLCQLLQENWTQLLLLQRGATFNNITEESFCQEYTPAIARQYPDVVALVGEKLDGIRGISGMRKQTARNLIAQHGSLQALLAAAHDLVDSEIGVLKPKRSGNLTKRIASVLIEAAEPLMAKKRAISIREDCQNHSISVQNILRQNITESKLSKSFSELQISIPKFPEQLFQASIDGARSNDTEPYGTGIVTLVQDGRERSFALSKSSRPLRPEHEHGDEHPPGDIVSSSPETIASYLGAMPPFISMVPVISNNAHGKRLTGLSISSGQNAAIYISLVDGQAIPQCLIDVLKDRQIEKRGWFLKDVHRLLLSDYCIELGGSLFDLDIALGLLHAGADMTNTQMMSIYYKDNDLPTFLNQLEKLSLSSYTFRESLQLCDCTIAISSKVKEALSANGMVKLASTVEFPLIPVLSQMEQAGVPIDVTGLASLTSTIHRRIEAFREKLFQLWAEGQSDETRSYLSASIDLSMMIRDVLTSQLSSKSGASRPKQINNDVLSSMSEDETLSHRQREFASVLLSYRKLSNVESYCIMLQGCVHSDGRVRPTFVQTSSSGRLSTTGPNLQSMPSRAMGKDVRSVVRAREGFCILCADYSQVELRVIASLSGDENLRESFEKGIDVYKKIAAEVFKLRTSDAVTEEQRQIAKEVTYSIMYGTSPFGLSKRLGIAQREAKNFIEGFFKGFPKVKLLSDDLVLKATERGYASSLLGRRLAIGQLRVGTTERRKARRTAVNMPIQSTQAEMIKLAMIAISTWLMETGAKSRLVLQMHDELIFEVAESELESVKHSVREEMICALTLPGVEVSLKMGWGSSWVEAALMAERIGQVGGDVEYESIPLMEQYL